MHAPGTHPARPELTIYLVTVGGWPATARAMWRIAAPRQCVQTCTLWFLENRTTPDLRFLMFAVFR